MGKYIVAGILAGLALPLAPRAEEAPAAAQLIARNCFICHRADLSGTPPMPPLAGLSAEQIMESMAAFRSGTRESTIMGRIAKGYTDQQMRSVAEYMEGLK